MHLLSVQSMKNAPGNIVIAGVDVEDGDIVSGLRLHLLRSALPVSTNFSVHQLLLLAVGAWLHFTLVIRSEGAAAGSTADYY